MGDTGVGIGTLLGFTGINAALLILFAFWMNKYIGPYLTKKAENLAIKEDIKTSVEGVLQTEFSKGYAGEKGKNLATKDDIDSILDVLRSMENVKASYSIVIARAKTIEEQCGKLMEFATAREGRLAEMILLRERQDNTERNDVNQITLLEIQVEVNKKSSECLDAEIKFMKYFNVAELTLTNAVVDSYKELEGLADELRHVLANELSTMEEIESVRAKYYEAFKDFRIVTKDELASHQTSMAKSTNG